MCGDQDDGAKRNHRLAQPEYRMWQAQDLDVESVGRMPPVVKGCRGQHRQAAPRRYETTERAAKPPHGYSAVAVLLRGAEGRCENCVTTSYPGQNSGQVDHHVRGCPERVASDGNVPRDIPVSSECIKGDCCDQAPHVPSDS